MPWGAHDPRDPSVAKDTSTRVGDVLERAEARAREIREQAERSASETRRTARHEAEGIAKEARRAAATAARARVHRIRQLQASIGDRAEALVHGLDGGETTTARLEELVEALGAAAERVLSEVEGARDAPERRHAAPPPAPRAGAGRSSHEIQGSNGPGPLLGEGKRLPRARPSTPRGARAPFPRPERITDPLPEGAPMVRKPKRSNPRFTAVMMAIQGSGREEVAAHLAREHGVDDSDRLLDEIFGQDEART
jgi:vacuolar-type H+-ATPase subunit H